jgi:hypothetical protein
MGVVGIVAINKEQDFLNFVEFMKGSGEHFEDIVTCKFPEDRTIIRFFRGNTANTTRFMAHHPHIKGLIHNPDLHLKDHVSIAKKYEENYECNKFNKPSEISAIIFGLII